MKVQVNEVFKDLKRQYNSALKNNPFVSVSSYSNSEDSILKGEAFYELNDDNIGKFLNRSTPVLLHPDDTVEISLGKQKAEMRVRDLRDLKMKDFVDLAYEKYKEKDKDLDFSFKRVDSANAKSLDKELMKLAESYCQRTNKEIEKILKGKVREDAVYLISCYDHESGAVCDGSECIASGNDWDFHPGCCGLDKYKKLKLGNYRGAGSLASIVSNGLKKKLIEVDVDAVGYTLLTYGRFDPSEKESYDEDDKKEVRMESLFSDLRKKEEKEKQAKKDKLKNKKLSATEMIEVLKEEYGGEFYEDVEDETDVICFDSQRFYSYEDGIDSDFENFVHQYQGWYVEILDAESICLMPC